MPRLLYGSFLPSDFLPGHSCIVQRPFHDAVPSADFSHHMYTKSADHCHTALPSAYRFYHTGTVHGCHLRHTLLQVFLRKSMYYLPLFKHILLFLNEIYYLFCKYSNSFLNHSQFALYNLS